MDDDGVLWLNVHSQAAADFAAEFLAHYRDTGISSDEVYATSQKLFARLSQEQGHLFSSVFSDLYQRTPQLRINILRDKASAYGVSATRIENLLQEVLQNQEMLQQAGSEAGIRPNEEKES